MNNIRFEENCIVLKYEDGTIEKWKLYIDSISMSGNQYLVYNGERYFLSVAEKKKK
jgi:hypothetical protein